MEVPSGGKESNPHYPNDDGEYDGFGLNMVGAGLLDDVQDSPEKKARNRRLAARRLKRARPM